jgi:hypothetical protein
MTDDVIPLGPPGGDEERLDKLPEHEQDPDDVVGGGLMGSGGTAIDRGTDTIDGPDAQGARAGAGDDDMDDTEGIIPGPPAGGAQPYVPAITGEAVDDDDGDASLPDA